MIEVEKKFRLNRELKQKILDSYKRHDFKELLQIDEVFLKDIESFKDFKPGMPVIRLRQQDNKHTLTYKRVVDSTGSCIEHELDISDYHGFTAILNELGFNKVTEVQKKRLELKLNEFTIALDAVKDLGDFLEIEIITDATNVNKALTKIDALAETIGLNETFVVNEKYDYLLSQKKSDIAHSVS